MSKFFKNKRVYMHITHSHTHIIYCVGKHCMIACWHISRTSKVKHMLLVILFLRFFAIFFGHPFGGIIYDRANCHQICTFHSFIHCMVCMCLIDPNCMVNFKATSKICKNTHGFCMTSANKTKNTKQKKDNKT